MISSFWRYKKHLCNYLIIEIGILEYYSSGLSLQEYLGGYLVDLLGVDYPLDFSEKLEKRTSNQNYLFTKFNDRRPVFRVIIIIIHCLEPLRPCRFTTKHTWPNCLKSSLSTSNKLTATEIHNYAYVAKLPIQRSLLRIDSVP